MANNDNISELMTVTEAAELLNVHINTMRRWSDQGIIRSYRLGKRGDRRFSKKDIADLLHGFHSDNGDIRQARSNSS